MIDLLKKYNQIENLKKHRKVDKKVWNIYLITVIIVVGLLYFIYGEIEQDGLTYLFSFNLILFVLIYKKNIRLKASHVDFILVSLTFGVLLFAGINFILYGILSIPKIYCIYTFLILVPVLSIINYKKLKKNNKYLDLELEKLAIESNELKFKILEKVKTISDADYSYSLCQQYRLDNTLKLLEESKFSQCNFKKK